MYCICIKLGEVSTEGQKLLIFLYNRVFSVQYYLILTICFLAGFARCRGFHDVDLLISVRGWLVMH